MAQSKNLSKEPVTTVFNWTVKQSKDQVFMQMTHYLHKVARTFLWHMVITNLKSTSYKSSNQTILRLDNAKHLEVWVNSAIRQKTIGIQRIKV